MHNKEVAFVEFKNKLKNKVSIDSEFKKVLIGTIEKNIDNLEVVAKQIKIDSKFYILFIKHNNLDKINDVKKDNIYYKSFLQLKKYNLIHKSSSGFFPKNLKLVSINPNPKSFLLSDFSILDKFKEFKDSLTSNLEANQNTLQNLYIHLRFLHNPVFSFRQLAKIEFEDIICLNEKKAILIVYESLLNIDATSKYDMFYKIFIFDEEISKIIYKIKNDRENIALQCSISLDKKELFFKKIKELEKRSKKIIQENISNSINAINLARQNYYIFNSSSIEASIVNRNVGSVYLSLSEISNLFPNKIDEILLKSEKSKLEIVKNKANIVNSTISNSNSYLLKDFEELSNLLKVQNATKIMINETKEELSNFVTKEAYLHNKLQLSYILHLIEKLEKNELRLSSFQGYVYLINKHLFSMVEDLADIKYFEFQNILNRLEANIYKKSSKIKIRNRIRHFFNFDNKVGFKFPIESFFYPKSLVFDNEIDFILHEIENDFNKNNDITRLGKIKKFEILQKKATLLLAFYSGLRKNELRSRLLDDVTLFDNKLVIDVNYKGLSKINLKLKTRSAKRRVEVFINNTIHQKIISEFINLRNKISKKSNFLFLEVSNNKIYSKIASEDIIVELTKHIKNITARYCTFHSLRHSFATYQLKELLKNKLDYPYAIIQLSMMMGHETPEITISNYIHFDFLRLQNLNQ
ncbi:site-specific integrase [Aliarcobacter cryaerophilus]|uniref:site-specific integrase n=1 Tax=Aliarcobacter cryaerophilus TaxID=28198 RepID=UPI0021B601AD|nr:site-specific integrase [Aliarcobacter cryaerophilus]MCT7528492.1 site-specific integrase [Aliarcobacter cryaerophilus]